MAKKKKKPATGTTQRKSPATHGANSGATESGGMRWGSRLRKLRLARNLTLEELAGAAGCTKGYLSVIENALREVPSDSMIASLEKALGVNAGDLARAAEWERTPAHFRREVMQLAAREAAQREREKKLASLLAASGIDEEGKLRGALDEAYKSGELHRLIGAPLDPPSPDARTSDAQTSGAPVSNAQSSGAHSAGSHASGSRASGSRGAFAAAPLSRFLAREVPLINRVQAGYPAEFTDLSYPARMADEYVRCPDIDDADAFAARVVGESMMPEYREGDVVVFSPAREVRAGMDCFVRFERDGETTFKRVFFESGAAGEMIRLQPLNPAFSAQVVEREKVGGLYAAVSVIKKI
ncbi:MAG: LexA family transcriptional regulator [Phycisphaeraceae bacterium]|nr:LexA family transcriptional regulator [Phycisphaeraceae bacterium]